MDLNPLQVLSLIINILTQKNKLLELIEALDKLTPVQKEHLAREFIASMSMAASFEEFMNYMNNGGQR